MKNEPIDPIQAMVDGMSAAWMLERAATQMTLGALIARLESMPADAQVAAIGEPHSYRGYYSDLAFEHTTAKRTASDLLAECRKCMGKAFTGYKGGDFVMGELTPLWFASYGCCGEKLMDLDAATGELVTKPDEY